MPLRRVRAADGRTDQALYTRPSGERRPLALRRVVLARLGLCRSAMTCGCAPMLGMLGRDPQRLQQCVQLPTYLVLAAAKARRPDGSRAVIHGRPEPSWLLFLAAKPPHVVPLGFASALQVYSHVVWGERPQEGRGDGLARGLCLFELLPSWVRTAAQPSCGSAPSTGRKTHGDAVVLPRGPTASVAGVASATPPGPRRVLAQGTLGATGCFSTFDARLAVPGGTWDRDAGQGPLLGIAHGHGEAECAINGSPSPLLEHYPFTTITPL